MRSRFGLWGRASCAVTVAALLVCACGGRAKPLERFHVSHRADPGRYVDVPAVVLLEKLKLVYSFSVDKWQPYAELVHVRRIHLLKPEALHLRKIFIPYDRTSGILEVTARVTHPNGSVADLGQVKTIDYNRFPPGHAAAVLYNEPAAKVFAVPDLQVDDVLEYRTRRVIRDASWVEPLRVGGPYPIERGEVAIVYPDGFDVDFRVLEAGHIVDRKPQRLPDRVRADPNSDKTAGVPGTRLLWVFERVPALYPEPYRFADTALARQVQVQFKAFFLQGRAFEGFGGWNDVAKWYGRLIGDADAADASARKLVKEIGATRATAKKERIRRISRYLVNNLIPIPFDGGLASLKVHSSASVLAAKAGDAKDLANLALGLLRAAGVEGFPVLCSRRGTRALAPDLPTPEAFNSVAVAVASGGRYRYLSPDGFGLPAGRLPWQVQGSRGLLIRKSGAELVELPVDKADDNQRRVDIRLDLARDGSASGSAVCTFSGQDARRVRLELLRSDATARLQFMQSFLFAEDSALAVVDVAEPKSPDSEQPLKLVVKLRSSSLAEASGQALRFSVTGLLGKPLAFLWREGRRTAVDLGYSFRERVTVAVALPSGMGVSELPNDRNRDSGLVSIDDRFAVADGQAWLLRERVHKRAVVEPADYAELKSFYQALWQHQQQAFPIIEGGERGRDYGGEPF